MVLATGRRLHNSQVAVKCQQTYFIWCKNKLYWPLSNYLEEFYSVHKYVCTSDSSICFVKRSWVFDDVCQRVTKRRLTVMPLNKIFNFGLLTTEQQRTNLKQCLTQVMGDLLTNSCRLYTINRKREIVFLFVFFGMCLVLYVHKFYIKYIWKTKLIHANQE